eukprot:gene7878-9248_t
MTAELRELLQSLQNLSQESIQHLFFLCRALQPHVSEEHRFPLISKMFGDVPKLIDILSPANFQSYAQDASNHAFKLFLDFKELSNLLGRVTYIQLFQLTNNLVPPGSPQFQFSVLMRIQMYFARCSGETLTLLNGSLDTSGQPGPAHLNNQKLLQVDPSIPIDILHFVAGMMALPLSELFAFHSWFISLSKKMLAVLLAILQLESATVLDLKLYQRILKPFPSVMLCGPGVESANLSNFFVEASLLRNDNQVELATCLDGNKISRISNGIFAPFKKLKILSTTQQQRTLFRLKFVLKRYIGSDFQTISKASVLSDPIEVFSHTIYLTDKQDVPLPPTVSEVIPSQGPPTTRMVVLGSNFVKSDSLCVSFGPLGTSAQFYEKGTIICNAPERSSGIKSGAPVFVKVSNDGEQFSTDSLYIEGLKSKSIINAENQKALFATIEPIVEFHKDFFTELALCYNSFSWNTANQITLEPATVTITKSTSSATITTTTITTTTSASPNNNNSNRAKKPITSLESTIALSEIFNKHRANFKIYSAYIVAFDNIMSTMTRLRKKSSFVAFLDKCRSDPKSNNQDLNSLLIMPVQRLPRYVLLLNELLKNIPAGHSNIKVLESCIDGIKGVTTFINEAKRDDENMGRARDLQEALIDKVDKMLKTIAISRIDWKKTMSQGAATAATDSNLASSSNSLPSVLTLRPSKSSPSSSTTTTTTTSPSSGSQTVRKKEPPAKKESTTASFLTLGRSSKKEPVKKAGLFS